ncbi:MAG TPA: FHA domain-containing protein [Planctomycetota bacterium]|nr:FHA domain-containing protein [Planctomycetota bacterium]
MPFLVWDSPAGRNVRELDRALLVIGRDAGSDLVLDDATVSRRHALVQVEGSAKVTDLRSTTGTRINGAKLKPDLPCTLEPGDFLQVGKVVLSYHAAPPPPAPPSPPPRREAPPPRHARGFPWKHVGIGVAFVAVAGAAAFLALPRRDAAAPAAGETASAPAPVERAPRVPEPAPAPPEPAPKATEPDAPKEPEPAASRTPERAGKGELPPPDAAPDLPDLIEVDGKIRFAARVTSLGDPIEAVGADGRLYAIPAKRATRIEDRADLARRVAVARRRLAPDDLLGRVALAGWCLDRRMNAEARTLVREALSLSPEDKSARALDARLREQG